MLKNSNEKTYIKLKKIGKIYMKQIEKKYLHLCEFNCNMTIFYSNYVTSHKILVISMCAYFCLYKMMLYMCIIMNLAKKQSAQKTPYT